MAPSINEKDLENAAEKAMERAYCPYSKFHVGAALLTKDGSIITAANVENASYGGTICAERSAFVRAIAEGHREFSKIAICTVLSPPTSPCGICRQFMAEFGDLKVIMISSTSNEKICANLSELLPMAFTKKKLTDYQGTLGAN